MGVFEQLVRSFKGQGGGAPLDPALPGDSALAAWARDDRHHGHLAEPTLISRQTGACGDRIAYSLRMEGDRIVDVGVKVEGCQFTAAAAHFVADGVAGRTMQEALELSAMDIHRAIPELGEDHLHCGILALVALQKGLARYSLQITGHLPT